MTAAAPISLAHETLAASEPRIWALIPCAGSGVRAGTVLQKQYQPVAGQALVLHTLDAFKRVARIGLTLVVVAGGDSFFADHSISESDRWRSVPCGGATRAQSVANGLLVLLEKGAAEHDWVLVHDAARCLVLPEWIDSLIDACTDDAVGGLLAHPVPDTLKRGVEGRVVATTDRAHQWLAQTPQMFRLGQLYRALRTAGEQVTDESGAMEAIGLSPKLVRGSALNFKVTYPEDFGLAQAVLLGRRPNPTKDMDYDYP